MKSTDVTYMQSRLPPAEALLALTRLPAPSGATTAASGRRGKVVPGGCSAGMPPRRCCWAACVDHVTKPFVLKELSARIRADPAEPRHVVTLRGLG